MAMVYEICSVLSEALYAITEYMCNIWPRIYLLCGRHNSIVSSFMTSQDLLQA